MPLRHTVDLKQQAVNATDIFQQQAAVPLYILTICTFIEMEKEQKKEKERKNKKKKKKRIK